MCLYISSSLTSLKPVRLYMLVLHRVMQNSPSLALLHERFTVQKCFTTEILSDLKLTSFNSI